MLATILFTFVECVKAALAVAFLAAAFALIQYGDKKCKALGALLLLAFVTALCIINA